MDLRGMLNTDGGSGAGRGKGPAAPPSTSSSSNKPPPPAPPPSISASTSSSGAPATPIQSGPPSHAFRDYAHPVHASPVAQPRDYNPTSTGPMPGPYTSPTSYHPPPNAFRQPIPPLQPPSAHDLRSPRSASVSAPSPYRQTPTSSVSASSGSYPFPASQQPPASPSQRHKYGPSGSYSRDSYGVQQPSTAPPPPPLGVPTSHGFNSYAQSQSQSQFQSHQAIPQTPPVGTPGGSHQYLQQRSLSIQSSPTPTSAHSQHPPFGGPYSHGSPVATTQQQPQQYPPPPDQHYQRQSSQPPTPLGPPLSGPPRQSPALSYQQPPSPYQQRLSSAASYTHQQLHASPPPLAPSSIPRMSAGSQGGYDAVGETHRRSQSQTSRSERDRSVSVSPKTRVPSLPNSVPQHRPSISSEPGSHPQSLTLPPTNITMSNNDPRAQRDVTSAKRKLDERGLHPEELEGQRQPPPPPKMNGSDVPASNAMPRSSTSPTLQRRKRIPRGTLPDWAQSGRDKTLTTSRNFSLKQHLAAIGKTALVNGNIHIVAPSVKSEHASRQTSPETTRTAISVQVEEPPRAIVDESPPFPWEPSIENTRPMETVTRAVADFLANNVLKSPHSEEIQARGIQFEIEAKLGTIIDKDTNDRIYLPIRAGECILGDDARIAFRSSMTEIQHRELNEYLNEQVKASFHRNPTAATRVPVQYVHRREIDRFFELPATMRQRLPTCVSGLLPQNAPVKARISYDQKTGNVLAKIVKARIADLHIYLPHMPLDCRISINLEYDWDGPPEEIEHNQVPNRERPPDRNKDRLSYTHGYYQIDLTQVTQSPHGHPQQQQQGAPTKEHELEVELNSQALIEHGRLLIQGRPSRFSDLVDGLVDNVRILARRCPVDPHM